jgi:hypothetical protein
VNEVKQGPSKLRQTFSHESDRDSQLGDRIRHSLESVDFSPAAIDTAVDEGGGGDGFETPKPVSDAA